jgi:hypothetical protein
MYQDGFPCTGPKENLKCSLFNFGPSSATQQLRGAGNLLFQWSVVCLSTTASQQNQLLAFLPHFKMVQNRVAKVVCVYIHMHKSASSTPTHPHPWLPGTHQPTPTPDASEKQEMSSFLAHLLSWALKSWGRWKVTDSLKWLAIIQAPEASRK